eukprot:NODE_409_length_9212_cov_0.585537.p9 type:complete len:140 gc:universal NODE_409_length_9212_cov_0.585537:1223-804(-)
MSLTPGKQASSKLLAYGIGTSAPVILCKGASNASKVSGSSIICAAISLPTPKAGQPPSTDIILLVFCTLSNIVLVSSGRMLLRLITSHDIPFDSSIVAASKHWPTLLLWPTSVTSVPSRSILALPIGNTKSLPRTSSET